MKSWEYNVLGIINYKHLTKYSTLFSYVKKNYKKIHGDIIEAGVFKASFLLSMSLFLKENKINKKVYGFDSFQGFPKSILSNLDNVEYFKHLYINKNITKEHLLEIQKNLEIKKCLNYSTDIENISTSKNFSETSLKEIKKKINYLKLKNIVLIKGNFAETFINSKLPKKIFMINLDCDLYESCKVVMESCWSKVVDGGLIWLDEYYSLKFPGPKIFIDEFTKLTKQKIRTFYDKHNDFYRNYIIKNG